MRQKGFVGLLILVIVALALLKYLFDWSILDVIASEKGRATINYIRDVLNIAWSYIKVPVMFFWRIVVDLFSSR